MKMQLSLEEFDNLDSKNFNGDYLCPSVKNWVIKVRIPKLYDIVKPLTDNACGILFMSIPYPQHQEKDGIRFCKCESNENRDQNKT